MRKISWIGFSIAGLAVALAWQPLTTRADDSAPMKAGGKTAAAAPASASIKGEVVDLGCYLSHQAKGAGHAKCGASCMARGMPAGLLTADGSLYLLTPDHADDKPYKAARDKAGSTIVVTGEMHEANGMKSLEVKKID
jgi:hypothetical protein